MQDSAFLIREEREADFPALYEFVRKVFSTAKVSDGDEQDFMTRLRTGRGYLPGLALVAECDGLAGHVMLTRADMEDAPGDPQERVLLLAPLSVRLNLRGQGLGSLLVEEALRRAKDSGFAAVALVGDPAYYGRFGFAQASRWGLAYPGVPEEYCLALELAPGALSGRSGKLLARA